MSPLIFRVFVSAGFYDLFSRTGEDGSVVLNRLIESGRGLMALIQPDHAPAAGGSDHARPALVDTPAPGATGFRLHFVAVAEVERFATFARHVGYALSRRVMASLRDQIAADLHSPQAELAGRATVEFAFSARSEADARARLMKVGRAFARMPELAALGYELKLAIGVTATGAPLLDVAALARAEQALALAQQGRQRVVFSAADGTPDVDSISVLTELQTAIRDGQLENHYQPKLRTRTREVAAVEALVRWIHPARGMIMPDTFVPLAEESGQIRALTELVIDRALADREQLRAHGVDLVIDVNLSGALLSDLDFAAWALARLTPHAGAIGFEITETAMIANPDSAFANLTRFADAGIRIAIDDYGAAFSSLAYLQKLPANELKIDKSFISGIANTQRDPLLVRSTIELAHALDMEVVAEGVDTPEALALLQVMGCDAVQGYLIAKPLPLSDLMDFIRSGRASEIGAMRPTLRSRRLGRAADASGDAANRLRAIIRPEGV